MTRIAVLADIHGNMPAFEAVCDDLEGRQVDEVLVGGDLVGRGPQGSRVIRLVREQGWPAIRGNHEDYLLGFRTEELSTERREAEEWAAARWMAAELDEDAAAYIASLPFSLARTDLRLVHGTPRTNRQGIGSWTDLATVAAHHGEVVERVLVCAHTHRPLIREVGDGMVVNVGSVGLPFNRDPRAQYAIFTADPETGWRVEPRQVPYDRGRIFEIYEKTGFLAEGGVTARLLRLELEHATPLLVPFLEWAKMVGVEATSEQLERFFTTYQPESSLRVFFQRLQQQAG